jgi:hypothetical protein
MVREELPPRVKTALAHAAGGASWQEAADLIGIRPATLRKYARETRGIEFVDSLIREQLSVANSTLVAATPRLAQELIEIALDHKNKAYSRIQAIQQVFAIVQSSVIEGEQRRQLLEIRRQLQALEDGSFEMRAIDV